MKFIKLLILPFAALAAVTVSACSGEYQKIDYAHNGSTVLNLEYSGHSFWTDGVEQVSLKTCIDGDTAHFTTSTGALLKSRFYGIDTPESTGKVQPYGKGASNYTKAALQEANTTGTIVISSPKDTYGVPEPDSTGSRYVSLVWINPTKKNAPLSELYLLNLMIVQDGWSWVKNVLDMPQYADTFYAAQKQQEEHLKENLYSGQPDPDFNYGGYEDTPLIDIKRAIEECIEDPTKKNIYDNKNVRIQGTVGGYSNNILYLQNFYKKSEGAKHLICPKCGTKYSDNTKDTCDTCHVELGEFAGINIFTGMTAIPSKYTKINAYLEVYGVCGDSENFGFQISGASFPTVPYATNDARVIIKAEDNTEEHKLFTFNYTQSQLANLITAKEYDALYCNISISDPVTVTGGYKGDSGDITLYLDRSLGFNIYVAFPYRGDPDKPLKTWDVEDFKNQKFLLKGVLSIHKTSSGKYQFQVCPNNTADLVWQKESA